MEQTSANWSLLLTRNKVFHAWFVLKIWINFACRDSPFNCLNTRNMKLCFSWKTYWHFRVDIIHPDRIFIPFYKSEKNRFKRQFKALTQKSKCREWFCILGTLLLLHQTTRISEENNSTKKALLFCWGSLILPRTSCRKIQSNFHNISVLKRREGCAVWRHDIYIKEDCKDCNDLCYLEWQLFTLTFISHPYCTLPLLCCFAGRWQVDKAVCQ